MVRSKKPQIAPIDRFRHRHLRSFTTKDIGQHKSALEKDSPINCRLEDSYIPSDREKKVTCADNDAKTKTSEYAFFKKLKKEAGLRFHSCPVQKDASLLKKAVPTDCSRERVDCVRVGSKAFNTSRNTEEMSTVRNGSFLPPSSGAWNNSDLYSVSSIHRSSQTCGDTFKPHGNKYVHGEIFTRKRQKLHQCVADALCPDIESFSLKGHNIVSMLLSRLFPVSIKENKYEDLNPGKEVNSIGYDLLDSRKSDVQFEEHDQIPLGKLNEQSSSYSSDNLLSPILLTSDERIIAHAAFLTSNSHKFHPPCCITEHDYKLDRIPTFSAASDTNLGFLYNEVMNASGYGLLDYQDSDVQSKEHCQIPETKLLEHEPNSCVRDHFLSPVCHRSNERIIPEGGFPISYSPKFQPESDFGGIPSFTAKSDVTLKFLFNEEEHDTFTLDHYKDLGKLKREPTPLLLERDFNCPKDEINLPIPYYPKPDVFPSLPTLGIGEDNMLKNILGECHLSSSSLILDKPQDITSILDSCLLRYQEFRFGKYVYEEKDDMDMNINHTISPLSHNKHHFELSADCKNDPSCVHEDSFYISPHQHWIRSSAYNDNHQHPDSKAWLSSSLDFLSGPRCLSLTSFHSNYQGSNSMDGENMSSLFRNPDNFEPEMDSANLEEVVYHFRKGLIEIYNTSFLEMSMERENGYPLPLDGSDYINELEHNTEYDLP